jgi:hypothetical protein
MSAALLHSARWTAPTSQIVALRVRCVIHQLEWLRTGFQRTCQPLANSQLGFVQL